MGALEVRLLTIVAHSPFSKPPVPVTTPRARQEIISPKVPRHHISSHSQLVAKPVSYYVLGTETLHMMLSAT